MKNLLVLTLITLSTTLGVGTYQTVTHMDESPQGICRWLPLICR